MSAGSEHLAETDMAAWVIVEMHRPADGDALVWGPFYNRVEAFEQARAWSHVDGRNWTYLPVRLEPPSDWTSEQDT